jgi:deoxyribonuclease V
MLTVRKLHSWDVSPAEAALIQEDMRRLVKVEDDLGQIRTVAGVDVGYSRTDGTAIAGVAVLTFPELSLIETATAVEIVDFPYVPGLLSFREIPAILAAMEMVTTNIDLILVDGQGIAHPRRAGIASHLGVLLDLPTIGCAKSRLVGKYKEPGLQPGSYSPLMVDSERIGSVLRTKLGVKPLFISPGHKVGFDTSIELVLKCVIAHRLPEPTRLADKLASRSLVEPLPG